MNSILAIVVTYNPGMDVLFRQIQSMSRQGVRSVLVDNKSGIDVSQWNASLPAPAHHVISLEDNMGIAHAHNVGIAWAKAQGFQYVMLMDQDSVPGDGMVANLLQCAASRQAADGKVGAVGPRYFDPRQNNPPPFLTIRGLKLHRFTCEEGVPEVPVDYLISSGSLIPIETLDAVGGMREDLFIDYVDIEWGLRAGHHGYQSYGVCSAKMEHSLGDNPVRFFKGNIPIRSPLRHYYHFRNAVLLYRSRWLPLNWKLVDGSRLILRYGFYTLFAKPRFTHWRMMTLGMVHGLINRSGKL
jgi:rhamnosyltransferase